VHGGSAEFGFHWAGPIPMTTYDSLASQSAV
jgi:hypothetical protein